MTLFDLVAKLTLDSSNYEEGLTKAQGSAKGFASSLGKGLATSAKVAATAVAAVTTATIAAAGAFTKSVANTAAYGDNIDKMSQKMGLSAQAYQEWDAVMQHAGTSIESLRAGMKTLANAVENGNEAFQRLGISQEQIASMNNEELFSATIAALQNVDDETERTYLAGQLLGRGATELGALLNMSAEEVEQMRDRVHELGGVMSDEAVKAAAAYTDSVQDMKTAFSGLSRNFVSEFLPSVTKVTDGLTEIFSGNSDKGLALIESGVDGVINTLDEKLPKLLETGGRIVSAISNAIQKNFPKIIKTGSELVVKLISGIVKSLPQATKGAGEFVTTVTKTIAESLPEIVRAGAETLAALAQGIADSLPELVPTIVDVVLEIVDVLTDPANLGALVDGAIAIITGLAEGLIAALPRLIERLPEIVDNVVTGISENAGKLADAALAMILSIADYLSNNENWGDIGESVVTVLGTLISGASGLLVGTAGSLVSSLAGAITTAVTGDPEMGKAASDAVDEFTNGLINNTSEKFPELAKSVLTHLGTDLQNAKSLQEVFDAGARAAHEFMLGIFQTMPELWEVLKAILTLTGNPEAAQVLDNFAGAFRDEMAQEAEEALRTVPDAADFDLQSWLDTLDPLERKLAQDTMAAFEEEATQGGTEATNNVVDSIASILGSPTTLSKVMAAAKALGQALTSGLKVSLEEKSPSRVARRIGKFFGEGLELGVLDEVDAAQNAADELADSLVGAFDGYDYDSPFAVDTDTYTEKTTDGGENGAWAQVVTLLQEIRDNVGGDVVLDSGELVGYMDNALGVLSARKARNFA